MKAEEFQQVTPDTLLAFMDVMARIPERVVLAYSDKELRTGVPLAEIIRPPYMMTTLAVGVVLSGTCSVCGESLWLGITEGCVATARNAGQQDDGRHWTPVTKDRRKMKIYFPRQSKRPTVTSVSH